MDGDPFQWFWLWIYPLLPASVLIVLSAEYRAWRDRHHSRELLKRLDRIAATLSYIYERKEEPAKPTPEPTWTRVDVDARGRQQK